MKWSESTQIISVVFVVVKKNKNAKGNKELNLNYPNSFSQ